MTCLITFDIVCSRDERSLGPVAKCSPYHAGKSSRTCEDQTFGIAWAWLCRFANTDFLSLRATNWPPRESALAQSTDESPGGQLIVAICILDQLTAGSGLWSKSCLKTSQSPVEYRAWALDLGVWRLLTFHICVYNCHCLATIFTFSS